ncbi:MAG TPA: PaaI family thioesterase, partial [Acidobacteriota bacterium]|nr:PaaI family thioesterase [Acidobacteriota bacterium]
MAELPGLKQAFSSIAANRFFGFVLVRRSAGSAVVTMEIKPEHLQEGGVVHGGIISSLADTAAIYPFYPDLEEGRSMTSIEFKMNFV